MEPRQRGEADRRAACRSACRSRPGRAPSAYVRREDRGRAADAAAAVRGGARSGGLGRASRSSKRVTISGPFNATGAEGHAEPPPDLRVPAARPRPPKRRAPKRILSTLARRAYRRPVTDADLRSAAGVLRDRPEQRELRHAASSSRCGASSPIPNSCSVSNAIRSTARPAQRYRVSDLELASRLSFFLWSSIPDERLLTLASQGRLRSPARARTAGAADAGRPARGGADAQLRRPVAVAAEPAERRCRTRTSFPTSTTTCGRRSGARPSCSSTASSARTAACSTC